MRTIKRCAVVGGGIIGIAVARELSQQARRRPGHRLRKGRPAGRAPDRAQLRGGSRGPLLRTRRAEGTTVPQGSGAAAGILRHEEPALRSLRQAGHRPDPGGIQDAWTASSPALQPTGSPVRGCSGESRYARWSRTPSGSLLCTRRKRQLLTTRPSPTRSPTTSAARAGPSVWGRKSLPLSSRTAAWWSVPRTAANISTLWWRALVFSRIRLAKATGEPANPRIVPFFGQYFLLGKEARESSARPHLIPSRTPSTLSLASTSPNALTAK